MYDKENETGIETASAELHDLAELCTLCGICPCPDIRNDIIRGKTEKVREKGMPRLRTSDAYGDLYAHILVQVPQNLSDEENDLFARLRTLRSESE